MTQRAPDVTVENRKGPILLRPVAPAGRAWLEAEERHADNTGEHNDGW